MEFYNCYFDIKDTDTDQVLDSFFYIDRSENTLFSLRNYRHINGCLPQWSEQHIKVILNDISHKFNSNYDYLSMDDLHYYNIIINILLKFTEWSLKQNIYIHFKFYRC